MTQPMFFITPRRDSGIAMPDLNITDEKFLLKYGSDLTANFADIKAHGAKAFFQKKNNSTDTTYSLCTCATGYIWVSVRFLYKASTNEEFSDLEIQIGTFALRGSAITTVEIPFQYRDSRRHNPLDGQLTCLCSTVIGKYLRLRMMGQQYEYATETAISESRRELSALRIVDPGRFGNFDLLLKELCNNSPMPPVSDISLISRSMITGRWKTWREGSILRRRYIVPKRVIRCFRPPKNDSIDLLSECFQALTTESNRLPFRKNDSTFLQHLQHL
jgi:hypothetical protein